MHLKWRKKLKFEIGHGVSPTGNRLFLFWLSDEGMNTTVTSCQPLGWQLVVAYLHLNQNSKLASQLFH